jgi:hypothetical protein
MDFTEFGWREAWMLAVVAAAAYLAVSLLRLVLVRRRRNVAPAAAPDTRIAPTAPDSALPQAVEATPPLFAERLAWTRLEVELAELRAQLTAMATELAAVRAELSELKVARRVSPMYAEAVALARRGYDARGIAEECGISVAEAELVLSMSSGSKDFDDEVDDGGSGPVEPSGRR